MKSIKNSINEIVLCIFEVVVGILLLVNPEGFTKGIVTTAGVTLLVVGLFSIIKYFRIDAEKAAEEKNLFKGLIALSIGAFCALNSEWFIDVFPAVTLIYGIIILIAGLAKIQLAVDILRSKNDKWFLFGISALVSIACAILILNNPFTTAAVLWTFTGVSLIIEAIIDIIALFAGGKDDEKEKESEKKKEEKVPEIEE